MLPEENFYARESITRSRECSALRSKYAFNCLWFFEKRLEVEKGNKTAKESPSAKCLPETVGKLCPTCFLPVSYMFHEKRSVV